MPRTPAKFTQADIGRAIREMMKACGSAQVIFDKDGTIRVVAACGSSPSDNGNRPVNTRINL